MAKDSVDPELAARLQELGRDPGGTVKIDEIAEVVEAILATMQGDLSAVDVKLYEELESLSNFIAEAKSDIAALRPDEVKDEFLPKAADELDAIVDATAEATNSIMDAVGEIEEVMGKLRGKAQKEALMDATTKIYEACGFQDITGQRITKVVGALQHIEEKVDALLTAFGDEIAKYKAANPDPEPEPEEQMPTDEELLHGPQKKDAAMSQDDIDALLNSFD